MYLDEQILINLKLGLHFEVLKKKRKKKQEKMKKEKKVQYGTQSIEHMLPCGCLELSPSLTCSEPSIDTGSSDGVT